MAAHRNYYDVSLDDEWRCSCGARFIIGDEHEPHDQLYDVHCPGCGRMVLIVSYPTPEQTRRAAAAGNPSALSDLEAANKIEARWNRIPELQLKRASELPRIRDPRTGADPQGPITIGLTIVEAEDEHWFSFRCGEQELWRELAIYESVDRFCAVRSLFVERYSPLPVSVNPDSGARSYLLGDKAWSIPKDYISTEPPTPIRGYEAVEQRVEEAPFAPCYDLYVAGYARATLFYDQAPECAHTTSEIRDDADEPDWVPPTATGPDEDPVGWCIQFSDEPDTVRVVLREPSSWHLQARALAWALISERARERGALWMPRARFRIWEHPDADPR